MKKAAAAIITAFMFVQLLAVSAFAEPVYTEGTLYYTVDGNSVSITGYFGKSETVYIPAVIAGLPVTNIAPGAFVNTAAVTVHLPSTVETVETGAIDEGVAVVYSEYTVVTTTATPSPTPNGSGGETPSPSPTAAPTPSPTAAPTATPRPTATPKPTATPRPTATPKPTHTIPPSGGGTTVIAPTASPIPTPKHTPSPTVQPGDGFDVTETDIDISEPGEDISDGETAEPAPPVPTPTQIQVKESVGISLWLLPIIALLIIGGAVYFLLYKKRNKEDE